MINVCLTKLHIPINEHNTAYIHSIDFEIAVLKICHSVYIEYTNCTGHQISINLEDCFDEECAEK
jgi:hypothetical protein